MAFRSGGFHVMSLRQFMLLMTTGNGAPVKQFTTQASRTRRAMRMAQAHFTRAEAPAHSFGAPCSSALDRNGYRIEKRVMA
jgi:hypothetical protein